MKKGTFGAVAFAGIMLSISGCASNGGSGQSLNTMGNAAGNVASGIGRAVGNLFKPYENGVYISQEQLDSLKPGMSPAQVESVIGPAPEISSDNGAETWSYPFTRITHFQGNTNETTLVRFDSHRKMIRAYKSTGRSSSTGNALVDAANGAL